MATSAKKAPRPFSSREERFAKPIVKAMSHANTWLYRISRGRFGGTWIRGAPVMLLTYTGRKSGEKRTTPLLYLRDGNDIIVVGSQGGMSKHPLWFLNLEANPDCEVEIGPVRTLMRSRRVNDDEKARLWPRLTEMYMDFDDYQARTERNIPVLRLSPR